MASVRAHVEVLGGSVRMVAHLDDTDVTPRVPESAA
ncbi:hypothetical protein FHX42_000346 [Saccharopolyspora lacisalsi]|uniref:Uncharacterized protein n=1 Tax=Halosaccharopolyspora lacisalsi TaxID=1000566 RepID=A0A839DUE3_9PSEU|nr:hypothetical protein [Halosaccharopolyspora lacisalsi]